jgi:1,4-alpha-glucan branching enzyme
MIDQRTNGQLELRSVPSASTDLLTPTDLHLFNEGNHLRLYDKLGAHPLQVDGVDGTHFAVWAPNAEQVSVETFGHPPTSNALRPSGSSGIWEGFVAGIAQGTIYKYRIISPGNMRWDKADPFAFHAETPPQTASVVWNLDYEWSDRTWMADRHRYNNPSGPISVYEMHLGSWRRHLDGNHLTYREVAHQLAEYLQTNGFTHVEFLPLTEHPFYGSWGYQTTGYFAPTSRYGTPQDLMFLIDTLHQAGLGVILDWVPSHFPGDAHGLAYFDGTHLFEHADPRQGFHPDWNSYIFNYGRNEVRSFLLSSALFWLDKYHIDALRVDAVASMLYLDYSRKAGEWIPNKYGGRENLEAISFLRQLNYEAYKNFPDVQMIAEESTAWPMVSRPDYVGGLGFGMKWDMGWMHDTLSYLHQDPVHRKYHHDVLTFRQVYAFNENFMLPLSHDEVVHGKGSLLGKMPGDEWQQFANLRLLFGYMTGQPGKKLQFMGNELAERREWNHDGVLDWQALADPKHLGVQHWVRDLNLLYRREPALYELDFEQAGFQWINGSDSEQSVVAFMRKAREKSPPVVVVCNFTPVVREPYRIGVPHGGYWQELLNSDGEMYGGTGRGNAGGVMAEPVPCFGFDWSLQLVLPPLGVLFFKGGETG